MVPRCTPGSVSACGGCCRLSASERGAHLANNSATKPPSCLRIATSFLRCLMVYSAANSASSLVRRHRSGTKLGHSALHSSSPWLHAMYHLRPSQYPAHGQRPCPSPSVPCPGDPFLRIFAHACCNRVCAQARCGPKASSSELLSVYKVLEERDGRPGSPLCSKGKVGKHLYTKLACLLWPQHLDTN